MSWWLYEADISEVILWNSLFLLNILSKTHQTVPHFHTPTLVHVIARFKAVVFSRIWVWLYSIFTCFLLNLEENTVHCEKVQYSGTLSSYQVSLMSQP